MQSYYLDRGVVIGPGAESLGIQCDLTEDRSN